MLSIIPKKLLFFFQLCLILLLNANQRVTKVKENFTDHFGDLEPFHYAVTREQALIELHDFMVRNRHKLQTNQRLPFVYSTWDKFDKHKQAAISEKAAIILELMKNSEL